MKKLGFVFISISVSLFYLPLILGAGDLIRKDIFGSYRVYEFCVFLLFCLIVYINYKFVISLKELAILQSLFVNLLFGFILTVTTTVEGNVAAFALIYSIVPFIFFFVLGLVFVYMKIGDKQ